MIKEIEDVGVAAYLRLHGFKVIGKRGRAYYFSVKPDEEVSFNEAMFDFPNSPYHDYDSHLIALKKLPNYLPNGFGN